MRFLSTRVLLTITSLLLPLSNLAAAHPSRAAAKLAVKSDPELVKARWQVLGASPLAMYYYAPGPSGLESLEEHVTQMTLVAPQSFAVDGEGEVAGAVPPAVLEAARQAKVAVMPLVVNPGFDRDTARALLRNPRAQQRAVVNLARLAERFDFVGWQLDLEYIAPADKSCYTRFVQRVAATLHREGRLLSVAVVPRFSDVYPDVDPRHEFHSGEWGAPYDFRALGRAVDFMTLMTYDHHSSATPPGPVAGYDWVKAAVEYATRRVPRQKILLGIPFYGREWITSGDETSAHTLSSADARNRMDHFSLDGLWDERWRTPWFQYSDADGVHTGWYENSRSLEAKLGLMEEFHLRGFAAWKLGAEDPTFWSLTSLKERPQPQHRRHATHPAGTRAALKKD
jgi:spore germination protein YaaH